ncbi:hypothetical protein ACGFIE_13980 [Micromonospora sp. NPDC049275]|uniref:hypothetical protein n=1 Tax=Micromonospora sp. NPDC049275 TaxID=3364268 RepID=UPI0037162D81
MTNTGNDRSVNPAGPGHRYNTKQVLLVVLAAWAVGAVVALIGWTVAGGERQPDDLLLLVVLLAIPGLIGLAVAWGTGRLTASRERARAES